MNRLRRYRSDLLALLAIFALALLWFAPVLFPALSGRTLLPFDNLAGFEPWRTLYPNLIPHNDLLSDLVLQNAVWKEHIRRTIAAGQIPLWNPQIFTGMPFFAGGQASMLYPLNILFYLLPLDLAYGWFTALQIALAGAGMYLYARILRLRVPAALFGGVAYMFSGFLVVSVVFTMFIAAVAWLPFILALIEIIIRKQEAKGTHSFRPIPYIVLGAGAIGVTILAGHPELIYYTLMVAGAYSLVRLIAAWRVLRQLTIDNGRSSIVNPGRQRGHAHAQAGRLALGHGPVGHCPGRGPAHPAAGAVAAQLSRRLGHAGAGAGLGVALAPCAHLSAAQHLWQPEPPSLV